MEENSEEVEVRRPAETTVSFILQTLLPLLVTGTGMVLTGILLDYAQHWTVFVEANELFILVPAVLGLAGNLQMTFAAQMSTWVNCGQLRQPNDRLVMVLLTNMAVNQIRGLVTSFACCLLVLILALIAGNVLQVLSFVIVCASTVITVTLTGLVLNVLVILLIFTSHRLHINPDNLAAPVSAFLGDLVTLAALAAIASGLYEVRGRLPWLAPVLVVTLILPVLLASLFLVQRSASASAVLTSASSWLPILMAMVISGFAGLVLNRVVAKYPGIAVFQPIFNGLGAGLVSVLSCRISTALHLKSTLGRLPEHEPLCLDPCSMIFGSRTQHSRTSRIMLVMDICVQVAFAGIVSHIPGVGHTRPTIYFFLLYILCSSIQIWVLMAIARFVTLFVWSRAIEPNYVVIPCITALGDLLGGSLLGLAFLILHLAGDASVN